MANRRSEHRQAALDLLRRGRTPRQVVAELPVKTAALYRWMAAEDIRPPGVRERSLSAKSHEILSAILHLEHVARPEGQSDMPGDQEIGAAWGVSKQRIGALRAEISDENVD